MSYLHRDEWLADAKRVPVGQNRRVYHGAERRPNLVVYNNEGSWSAYCHSCHLSGKVHKEVLQRTKVEDVVHRKYLDVQHLVAPAYLSLAEPVTYKKLIGLLNSKGVSLQMLEKWSPMYNRVDKRLVFRFDNLDIGRDTSELSKAKWYVYDRHGASDRHIYLQGKKTAKGTEPVILVEDLFSAMKINYYTGWSALCCLGTRISDNVILEFIKDPSKTPILMFDGDDAGDVAKNAAASRFGLRNIYAKPLRIADGLDPKDLNPEELTSILNPLENL